jgi:hypothetical protein
MGTIVKHARIKGRSLRDAFSQLQREDEEESGNNIYSGGWNNCQGLREVSKEEFDRRSKNEDVSKHESGIAYCVKKPISNTNKVKTEVQNFPVQGVRKWITKYVIYQVTWEPVEKGSYTTQTEAIKKARELCEKNPDNRYDILIEKRLEKGSQKCATITYKKSTKEADGVWEIMGAMSY